MSKQQNQRMSIEEMRKQLISYEHEQAAFLFNSDDEKENHKILLLLKKKFCKNHILQYCNI